MTTSDLSRGTSRDTSPDSQVLRSIPEFEGVHDVWPRGARLDINVLATRRVVEAAVAAGVRRVVHLSSIRAFSDLDYPDGVTESHPVRPDGNPYVDTKIASEHVLLQAHAAGEIEAVIVRSGDVYGPGSRPWVLTPLELMRSRQLGMAEFLLPARGKGIFSPVYVDDLVQGIHLAATRPEAAGQVFTVTGPRHVTTAEYFGRLAEGAGLARFDDSSR